MSNETNPDSGALLALVEQHAGENFLRPFLAWDLHQIMEAEVGEIAGVGKRNFAPEGREIWRYGYRRRNWETRVGTIPLNIPKLREGSYHPSFLESHRVGFCRYAPRRAKAKKIAFRTLDAHPDRG